MDSNGNRAVRTNITVWIGLIVFVTLVGGVVAFRASSLSRHFAKAQATIVELHPENHQSFGYTYRVGSHTYSGSSYSGEADIPFERIKIGDRVTIAYDTSRPEISTAGPADMPRVYAIGNLVAAIAIIPFLLMLLLHRLELLPYWKLFDMKSLTNRWSERLGSRRSA